MFFTNHLKLLYGTAFRAPMPLEITPDLGAFYNNNLQLRPEKIPEASKGIVEQGLGQYFTLPAAFPQLD